MIFILWGASAQKKLNLIDTNRHTVIQLAHPSPLSAHKGFFGSKPFSPPFSLFPLFGNTSQYYREYRSWYDAQTDYNK